MNGLIAGLFILGFVPTDTVSRWGFFAFASVTLFYWVIKQSRRLWRNAFFWGTIGGLLVVHTAAFSFVAPNLFEQRSGSVFFFFILAPVEAFTITMIVDKVVRRFGRHHRLEV